MTSALVANPTSIDVEFDTSDLPESAQRYARALVRCGGVVSEAARHLGVSRSAVSKMCRRYPILREIQDEAIRVLADEALVGLARLVREGDLGAIRTVLINHPAGRDLGFTPRIDLSVEGDVNHNLYIVERTPRAASAEDWEHQTRFAENLLLTEHQDKRNETTTTKTPHPISRAKSPRKRLR